MIAGMLAGAAGIVIVTRLPVLPGLLPVGGAVLLALVLACWCRPLPRLAACLVLGLAWGCLRGHELLARVLPAQLEGICRYGSVSRACRSCVTTSAGKPGGCARACSIRCPGPRARSPAGRDGGSSSAGTVRRHSRPARPGP